MRGRTVVHGRAISFESLLERDFLETVDFDDAVVNVSEQPVRIWFVGKNGRRRSYVPDFLVKRQTQPEQSADTDGYLFEIKYRDDLFAKWSDLKPKFKAARAWARERGYSFTILTEIEIRNAHLQNVRLLNQYRKLLPHPGIEEKLAAEAVITGEVSIKKLVNATWSGSDDRQAAYAYVLRMIAVGRLNLVDMNENIHQNSKIWIEAGVGFTSRPYAYRANRRSAIREWGS